VIGTEIFNPKEATYSVKKGPVLLQPRVGGRDQSRPGKSASSTPGSDARAAREQVGGTTYPLEEPFLVLATQNPIEQEGTYPLPEAQVDRFLMKVRVGYPSKEEERKVLDRMASGQPIPEVRKVATPDQIMDARSTVDQVFVDDKVRDYIVDLVHATRSPREAGISSLDGMIEIGASPRASISWMKAAKAHALIGGRTYVTPHDVKSLAGDILRHRIALSFEAEAEGKDSDHIIAEILDAILVP